VAVIEADLAIRKAELEIARQTEDQRLFHSKVAAILHRPEGKVTARRSN
jgi:hypothetical protein